MTSVLQLWVRRITALLLLAIGAFFAVENPHDVSLVLIGMSYHVPLYWLVFSVLGIGFFFGVLVGWINHTPKRPRITEPMPE